MKGFALILFVFVLVCSRVMGQDGASQGPASGPAPVKDAGPPSHADQQKTSVAEPKRGALDPSHEVSEKIETPSVPAIDPNRDKKLTPAAKSTMAKVAEEFVPFAETDNEQMRRSWALAVEFPRRVNPKVEMSRDESDDDDPSNAGMPEKFHWKPAIYQSLVAHGFQHGYALIFQEKTRRALKGPFFHDYWESVKGVRGWSDGNKFFTNYIAHPMQGAFTGFIYLQNHGRVKKQIFNESKQYWKDRAMALLWSAAWSTNWEIGPISQSSIGNVGLYGKQGYVDLVITPTVGTAWMIAEEALDRYIIRHLEVKNLVTRILLRSFLNPTRSVANLFRFKKPWYRDRVN